MEFGLNNFMEKKIKVGMVTTTNTNIGDDFIRKGILVLLENLFKDKILDIKMINKHTPFNIYKRYNPIRLVELLPVGRRKFYTILNKISDTYGKTIFDDREIIIQCGTPVIWPGCSNAEWVKPIWYNAIKKNKEKSLCLNLAAGSCFPFKNQNIDLLTLDDRNYLNNIFNYCHLTIVRDKLAKNILENLVNEKINILPCTAFLSGFNFPKAQDENETILINYMEGAGHYDWGQDIDKEKWENIIKKFISKYKNKYKIVFLAHNKKEFDLAKSLDKDLKRIWPKTSDEYFNSVNNVRVAICNRMHASVAMASLGIPSVAVCTDSRLKMVEEVGLPAFYVKDLDYNELEENVFILYKNYFLEKERLLQLQKIVFNKYLMILEKAVKNT
jgi:hypothetical protein